MTLLIKLSIFASPVSNQMIPQAPYHLLVTRNNLANRTFFITSSELRYYPTNGKANTFIVSLFAELRFYHLLTVLLNCIGQVPAI